MASSQSPLTSAPSGGAPSTGAPDAPFERLLVPIDFSDASRTALKAAIRLADREGSDVVLFHAAGYDGNEEFIASLGAPWSQSDILEEVHLHLKSFAETVCPGSGARVKVHATRSDDTVEAVAQAAEMHASTLAVIGTHRRRRMRRSTAERIAHALPCAVLLTPGVEGD
jgi:nucleotide-binding universal stress UspA family protein